jgi:glycosyltransferase involved in cell wall biosynthesis
LASDDCDILFVADARFPGGTSAALASEIEAAWKAGFRSALLHVNGPVLKRPHPFHPAIRAAIDAGKVKWADPARRMAARLMIVHHPMLFTSPPAERMMVRAERAVIVAHHPPVDGLRALQYDIRRQVDTIEAAFGVRPEVAPVGPNVRTRFHAVPTDGVRLTESDWHNLIDLDAWPVRPFRAFGDPIVIGRHSRPDPLKWPERPEDVYAAWPRSEKFRVRVLGAGPFLHDLLGGLPANWDSLAFGSVAPASFLAELDAYVYFHSSAWVEAFGRNVLEALATGLAVILPPSFKPLFREAAIYGEPADVQDILQELRDNPAGLRIQCERARAAVRERFSLDRFAERLARLYGLKPSLPAAKVAARSSPRGQRTVLFVSSNGIGIGHLTRQMAVARRLPLWLRPVFFTLSRAAGLARENGYLVEHTAFHRTYAASPERWNAIFAEELHEALLFHRPALLVFDGNVPYDGLLDAMAMVPELRRIWIRRAMWREHHGGVLDRAAGFDAVVEPGELAGEEDTGPTRAVRDGVHLADPVLMLRPVERLPRAEARAALAIDGPRLVVALQLGGGNNFDFAPIRHALLTHLAGREDVEVIELRSPVAEGEETPLIGPGHRTLRLYPAFRYSTAFDVMVSAAGYNSFHESILGAVPTLFVPNEAEEMDRQAARARYADRTGLGRFLSPRDIYSAGARLDEILDWRTRAEIKERCQRVFAGDGAAEIARFVEETIYGVRLTPPAVPLLD